MRKYSKNPWPLGIRPIPNLWVLWAENPGDEASWVLDPQNPPNSELCEFTMARRSCFYPMAVFIEMTMIQICRFGRFKARGEFGQFFIPAIPHIYALIMG